MLTSVSSELDHLQRVVRVVSRIHSLPAIATQDWCDRAAAALLGLDNSLTAVVSVGVFGPTGEVQQLECVGAASEVGDASGPAIRTSSLGWWLPPRTVDTGAPRCAILSRTPDHARWTRSAAGSSWQRSGIDDLVVALVPIPGAHDNRMIVVELGSTTISGFRDVLMVMLSAVLPELARRTAIAFGPDPIDAMNRITVREQEVLELLVLGRTVKQIATILSRSPHTVHDHVKSLHRKLRANSRGELVSRTLGHLTRGTRERARGTPVSTAEEKSGRFAPALARSA